MSNIIKIPGINSVNWTLDGFFYKNTNNAQSINIGIEQSGAAFQASSVTIFISDDGINYKQHIIVAGIAFTPGTKGGISTPAMMGLNGILGVRINPSNLISWDMTICEFSRPISVRGY